MPSGQFVRFDDIMLEIILGLALACRRDARNLLLLDKRITRVLKGADRFKKIKMMVESLRLFYTVASFAIVSPS